MGRKPAIGLCMIVRDEEAVIERCLASAKPLIDSWTICDTGSTDRTAERIEAALGGIPGTLHERPWVDFGHNRSELLALAADAEQRADYLLLLDADETLERRGALPELSADSYLLRHTGEFDYAIPRLIRVTPGWRYVGATHEYLDRDGDFVQAELPELVLRHHGDGGARADKLERDARLLEGTLAAAPDDARSTFYLAQTMRDMGEPARARQLYRRRVELGGWDEEVFYAAYQAALLLEADDPAAAIGELRAAHDLRPARAEPLCDAARICRDLERWEEGYELATLAEAIPQPADLLFVHGDVYRWRALLELGAAAWWTERYEEALAAAERLQEIPGLSPEISRIAEGNRQWALRSLGREEPPRHLGHRDSLAALVGPVELGEVRLEIEPAWPTFNPSIESDPEGDGFRMIVRSANYSVNEGVYTFLDDSGFIHTINYLAHLDRNLGLIGVEALHEPEGADDARFEASIRGWEDVRLHRSGSRWIGLGAARDHNPEGFSEVGLLELDGPRIQSLRLVPGPDPSRDEKSWAPFTRGDELLAVYTWGPTVVRRIGADGHSEVIAESAAPWPAPELRGGSQGVAVAGGWLFVVHEALQLGRTRRYSHRFALIGEDLALAGLSPPFHFSGAEIEYCCGMATAPGERLVISFGIDDRHAALALVDATAALATLEDPVELAAAADPV